jgi:hypothetical protein
MKKSKGNSGKIFGKSAKQPDFSLQEAGRWRCSKLFNDFLHVDIMHVDIRHVLHMNSRALLAHTTGNYMAISMVTVCCMSSHIEKGPTIPTCTLFAGYYVF